jgi:hypothetical protein
VEREPQYVYSCDGLPEASGHTWENSLKNVMQLLRQWGPRWAGEWRVFGACAAIALAASTGCSGEELVPLDRAEAAPEFETLSITITDYRPALNHHLSDFFALNLTTRVKQGELWRDLDKDGVPDSEDFDEVLELHYAQPDSNRDGYRDLLIYLSGIDRASQANLKECLDVNQDTDLDGLTDCEENNLLHTNPDYFDTDDDGVPDFLEVYYAMNPNDPMDAVQDIDGDGLSNVDEAHLNTPIDENNGEFIHLYEYEYDVELLIEGRPVDYNLGGYTDYAGGGDVTYKLQVNNIPVLDTPEGNVVRFFFIEKVWFPGSDPDDDPGREALRMKILHTDSIRTFEPLEIRYESLVGAGPSLNMDVTNDPNN